MKTIIYFFSALSVCLFFSCGPNGFPKSGTVEQTKENYRFPESKGTVNDLENILSEAEEQDLKTQISEIENKTKSELLLVTTDTIYNYKGIKNYAHAASKQWNRGHVNNVNGITLVVSKKLNELMISTGDSIFAMIPDSVVGKISDEEIIPEFKKNNFYEGIKVGLNSLAAKLKH